MANNTVVASRLTGQSGSLLRASPVSPASLVLPPPHHLPTPTLVAPPLPARMHSPPLPPRHSPPPSSTIASDDGAAVGRRIGDAAAAELVRSYSAVDVGESDLPEEFLSTSEPERAAEHGFVPQMLAPSAQGDLAGDASPWLAMRAPS